MIARKKWAVINALLMSTFAITLTGCNLNLRSGSSNDAQESVTEDVTENANMTKITSLINYTDPISTESSNIGLNPNGKKFMEQLDPGSFYVIHDGYYYPAFSYASNFNYSEEPKDYVAPISNKQMYYTAENEVNIPTLFLAQGDKLVYYDTENILDYVKWERYKDLGYTIGIYSIQQTNNSKRAYIDLEETEGCIISGSTLESINADSISPLVSLMKIGNVDITGDLVQDGLINGAKAGENYDLEVYDGTNYNHYIATADMHAFEAWEMFASTEIKALQQFAWEIKVPDYFVDGYYKMHAMCTAAGRYDGLVRIVRGNSFTNTADNFNEQLLYPYTETQIADGDADEDAFLPQYSDCASLNKFKTAVVGALGYEDGVEEKAIGEKADILKTANINKFDINFPKGETCTITITPTKRESGGDAYVLIGNRSTSLTYSAFDNTYNTSIKGDGNTYTLYVSGFWNSYDIRLGNCKQDTSGNSKSAVVENLTDDKYSLDGYEEQKKNDANKGKGILDALTLPNATEDAESSTEKDESSESKTAEEIITEVEDE